MKVNFNVKLLGLDNKPIKNEEDKDVLLKDTCSIALITVRTNGQDQDEDQAKKLSKFNLALKINNAKGEIDITPEEAVMIKESVSKFSGILALGRVNELLK